MRTHPERKHFVKRALIAITLIAMLTTVRARVAVLIDEGKTLEEVIAAKPTADFDETYGPVEESLGFLDRTYTSLSKKK